MEYSLIIHQVNTFGPNLTTDIFPNNKIWYQKIKEFLKSKFKDITVEAPNFPASGLPKGCTKETWVNYVKENYGDTYKHWIGHSIGGILGLYMAQTIKIDQLVLIGPHYLKNNKYHREKEDPVVEEYVPTITQFLQNAGYFKDPLDFDKIKQNTKKITIYVQKQDPLVPYSQTVELIKTLKAHNIQVQVIEDPHNDHFVRSDFKQLELIF